MLPGTARSSSGNEASSSEACPPSRTASRAGAHVPGAMGDQAGQIPPQNGCWLLGASEKVHSVFISGKLLFCNQKVHFLPFLRMFSDGGFIASSLKDVSLDPSEWTPEALNLQLIRDTIGQTDVTVRHESDGVEPQLSLEEIFTFSSRPHSARRCHGHTNPGEGPDSSPEMWGEGGGAHRGARLEDDFFGSESDEV